VGFHNLCDPRISHTRAHFNFFCELIEMLQNASLEKRISCFSKVLSLRVNKTDVKRLSDRSLEVGVLLETRTLISLPGALTHTHTHNSWSVFTHSAYKHSTHQPPKKYYRKTLSGRFVPHAASFQCMPLLDKNNRLLT
jgi:hypothetical protein